MAYTTQAVIIAEIPAQHLVDALDDDRDGSADTGLLDQIIANASNAVDSFLAGRYATPFDEPPALVTQAAFIFACETIYNRRAVPEARNPYKTAADALRARLKAIGDGQGQLDATTALAVSPGAAIVSDAATEASTL